ncbi:hypothetical protein ACNI3T_00725 [Christiangramia sp. ASW11-125]|uniref:hypothetical protein n=1 Tax=Christiangramia sp. ASW11-125 TaxID=3400701 RepID=UPI003AB09CD5
MEQTKKISDWINKNKLEIIQNIDYESVEVFKFLTNEFNNSDVSENSLFQFVYRSYYRLDLAGLTKEFKIEYFKIMQELRNTDNIDLLEIIERLYKFENLRNRKSVQFSFATKLANTIDKSIPIYDSQVCKVFNLSRPFQKDFDKKVTKYFEQLSIISSTYNEIIDKGLINETLLLFNGRFDNSISQKNKLDFIFWSAGKLISKIKKAENLNKRVISN